MRRIERPDLYDFLELLARGSMNEEKTLISKQYAQNLIILFDLEGCVQHSDF